MRSPTEIYWLLLCEEWEECLTKIRNKTLWSVFSKGCWGMSGDCSLPWVIGTPGLCCCCGCCCNCVCCIRAVSTASGVCWACCSFRIQFLQDAVNLLRHQVEVLEVNVALHFPCVRDELVHSIVEHGLRRWCREDVLHQHLHQMVAQVGKNRLVPLFRALHGVCCYLVWL